MENLLNEGVKSVEIENRELQRAKGKLKRIRREYTENMEAISKENELIPFGQPNIIGRRDIYKDIKRKYAKSIKLIKAEEKQERRIAMLEIVDEFKKENDLLKDVHVVGKSEYASVGAKTSVNNLDYFKEKLIDLEKQNEEAKAFNKTKPARKKKTYGAEITKLKKKISYLESMKEKDETKVLSEKTQALIDSGAVTQWKKKPIYYFVKGLKKVALEIDEKGNFFISPSYPAYSTSDEQVVKELLSE